MYEHSLLKLLQFLVEILTIFLPRQSNREEHLFSLTPGGNGATVSLHDLFGNSQTQSGVSGAGAP